MSRRHVLDVLHEVRAGADRTRRHRWILYPFLISWLLNLPVEIAGAIHNFRATAAQRAESDRFAVSPAAASSYAIQQSAKNALPRMAGWQMARSLSWISGFGAVILAVVFRHRLRAIICGTCPPSPPGTPSTTETALVGAPFRARPAGFSEEVAGRSPHPQGGWLGARSRARWVAFIVCALGALIWSCWSAWLTSSGRLTANTDTLWVRVSGFGAIAFHFVVQTILAGGLIHAAQVAGRGLPTSHQTLFAFDRPGELAKFYFLMHLIGLGFAWVQYLILGSITGWFNSVMPVVQIALWSVPVAMVVGRESLGNAIRQVPTLWRRQGFWLVSWLGLLGVTAVLMGFLVAISKIYLHDTPLLSLGVEQVRRILGAVVGAISLMTLVPWYDRMIVPPAKDDSLAR